MRQLFIGIAAAALVAGSAQADTLYSNDFSSNATGFTGGSIQTAPSGEMFLGPLYNGTTAVLTLDTTAYIGQDLTLGFTLYGIGSVDGDGQYGGGPDPFLVSVGATTLFNYNFANFSGNSQNFPVAGSAADAGNNGLDTLGYSGYPGTIQDVTYNFQLAPFTVTGASTQITFQGNTNEALNNEFYGIDNVSVTGRANPTTGAVPEPATWAMMVGGFGLVGGALRRRRVAARFA